MWNDESETAIFARSVLDRGYPSVYMGKNFYYSFELAKSFDLATGAYKATTWGHFYFCTIGELLARRFSDIYAKTACLRIPFALMGFFGILIFGFIGYELFKLKRRKAKLFFGLFILLELISIPTILHMREIRYYSLVIFLTASFLFLFIRYRFFAAVSWRTYFFGGGGVLFLLYNCFPPVFSICAVTVFLYSLPEVFKRAVNFFRLLAPVALAFLALLPVFFYFKPWETYRQLALGSQATLGVFLAHFFQMIDYLFHYDFLYLFLTVKAMLIGLRFIARSIRGGELSGRLILSRSVSDLLTLFFVVYMGFIIWLPYLPLFTRYFIVLQPIMVLIILIDIFLLYGYLDCFKPLAGYKFGLSLFSFKNCLTTGIIFVFFICSQNFIFPVTGHVYSLFHQYKGPLDYVIPYIKNNSQHPQDLIIATNYEESAYIYYLESKVICGVLGRNIIEDIKLDPDIIVWRLRDSHIANEMIKLYLTRKAYKRVPMLISDALVNNIPETNFSFKLVHKYKTLVEDDPFYQVRCYIRRDRSL